MGIRGLKSALRPYGTRCTMNGATVIDGPALIYHIYNLWVEKFATQSVLDMPGNEWLGDAVVYWLDELRETGTVICKIFFDACLPTEKLDIRMSRVKKDTTAWNLYYWSHQKKIPEQSHRDIDPSKLRHAKVANSRFKSTPPPTFLVVAVIERLLELPSYCDLVQLVPGEADVFCAQWSKRSEVLEHNILTGDSDLLVLAEDARIYFLDDLSLQFHPRKIAQTLRIHDKGGIPRLAYEFTHHHTRTFSEHLRTIRKVEGPDEACLHFLDGLNNIEIFPSCIGQALNLLDPRVSEFVLAFTRPEQLVHVFMPPLMDNPQRTSAWHSSEFIRRLTYSITAKFLKCEAKTAIEHRRPMEGSTGKFVNAEPDRIEENAEGLLNVFELLSEAITDTNLNVWEFLAVYLECGTSIVQNGSKSLSCELLKNAAEGAVNPTSWDFMHFSAHYYAVYFSLRALKQVLGLLDAVGHEVPQVCKRLQAHLVKVGSLRDLRNHVQLAQQMPLWPVELVFSQLSKLLGRSPEFEMTASTTSEAAGKPKKHKPKKKQSGDKNPAIKVQTKNPFEALASNN